MPFTALQFIQNSKKSNSFIGVFRYVKTSGVKSTKDGELYGFLEISSEGDFPAERVAHMAWDGVVEGYMYSQTKSISDSLKSGIQEFTRRLKDLMRNNKQLEQDGIEVNLVVISATKDGIYVANLGESEIYAYRGQKVVNVVEVLEKNNAQTAGFPTSQEDALVISTKSLISENMHVLVGKNSKEEVLKALNMLGKTLLPNQALFCIYFDRNEKKENIPVKNPVIKKIEEKNIKNDKPKNVDKKERTLFKNVQVSGMGEKLKKFFGEAKGILLVILGFLEKVFGGIGRFFKRIFGKLFGFLKGKLGNKRWFKKYAARASQVRLKKRSPNIKIDGYKTKDLRAKRIRVVILSTLAVFIAVLGYQYARKQRELSKLNNQAEEIFSNISTRVEDAKSNLNTNTQESETDIFAARNLLDEVPEGISDEYVERRNELEQEVLGVEDNLYKRVSVSPESFVGFFDEGTDLSDIEYVVDDSGNEILIITDKGTSSVWEVSVYDRSKNRMADNDGIVSSPEYVDIGNEGDVFVYDSDVGVIKANVNGGGWSAFKKLVGVGLNNIGVDDVGEFAVLTSSDNLYYLDTINGRIVKSVNYGSGYSSTTVSVINDEKFSDAHDFFADFSIYVLTQGDEGVLRYSAGSYVPISIVGVNGDLGDLLCGDTSGNMDFALYMFDSGSRRILKMEKPKDSYNDKLHPNELVLLNQYVYRGDNQDMWSNVKDIAIDRAEKYMYVLDGNNVWRISL